MDQPKTPETPANNAQSGTPKSGGLLRSSSIVSAMTLLSRVLGLVRDVFVASYFGARADAFFVAFKIPNFFRRLFAQVDQPLLSLQIFHCLRIQPS